VAKSGVIGLNVSGGSHRLLLASGRRIGYEYPTPARLRFAHHSDGGLVMRKGFALVGFAAALALAPALAQTKPKEKVEIEVPFVPTPQKVVDAMLTLAAVKPGDTVYDLGCGDGRIAITAVEKFKAKKGMGLDFNPERLKECLDNLKKLPEDAQKRLTFKQGDVLKMKPEDFKDVDVVTMYLLPTVNERLKPTLQKD
jgi:hypothetical protein